MTHTPDILPLQLIPSEFNTTNVNIMVNPFQICEVTEPGKDILLYMYMPTIVNCLVDYLFRNILRCKVH